MIPHRRIRTDDPDWCDVVMRVLPRMYRLGQLSGHDDYLFVYTSTFFSAKEELRRGAPQKDLRGQTSRILRYIDRSHRSEHDKELFAAPFARAVDDAIEGRPPCVLQAPLWAGGGIKMQTGTPLDMLDLIHLV
jgi:hypothetical protein